MKLEGLTSERIRFFSFFWRGGGGGGYFPINGQNGPKLAKTRVLSLLFGGSNVK